MATITDFNNLLLYQADPPAVPYLFGGIWLKNDPIHAPGFDCSGGPYAVAAKLGQPIPRTSEAQFANLPRISAPQRRGDAIFYDVQQDNQAQPAHVAIYWDSGHVWQAPRTGEDCGIYPNSALPYPIMGYCRLPFPDVAPPPPPQIGEEMIAPTPSGNGYWLCDQSGAVITRGDAEYLGGPNTSKVNGQWGGPPNLEAGHTCVSIAAHPSAQGYWIEDNTGLVYAYGAAGWYGNST